MGSPSAWALRGLVGQPDFRRKHSHWGPRVPAPVSMFILFSSLFCDFDFYFYFILFFPYNFEGPNKRPEGE